MHDVNILNEQCDLKELYETLFRAELKYRSHQWEGACPICGGTDRFRISDNRPHNWYCRNCKESGKAIDLVRIKYNLIERSQFREAVDKLAELMNVPEGQSEYTISGTREPKPKPVQMVGTMPDVPPIEWRKEVTGGVISARDYLWSKAGRNALAYLVDDRRFTLETIRNCCIGFNPNVYTFYGIEHEGEPVKALTGYWIPTFIRLYDEDRRPNTLMRVKIRKEDHLYKSQLIMWEKGQRDRKPDKYISVRGSKGIALFCAIYARPLVKEYPNIIYVEGEFDAMTINQVAGDICKAVTFGSHGNIGRAEQWQSWYRIPEHTIICFDNDPDPAIWDAVHTDAHKLQDEIIKAQSLDSPEYRAFVPKVRHLPEQYHDWNDILRTPNGDKIIRDILTGFFYDGNGSLG